MVWLGRAVVAAVLEIAISLAPSVCSAQPESIGGVHDGAPTAVASIRSHVASADVFVTPRVLFFGTRCNAHGLTGAALRNSLNALKEYADVDWYLFGNNGDAMKNGSDKDDGLFKHGSLRRGGAELTEADISEGDLAGSKHYALVPFLKWFASILADEATSNAYDFVVIESDGSRIASEYGQSGGRDGLADVQLERQVAELLRPYYADERVIWLLDNGYDYYHGSKGNSYFGYVDNSQHSALGLAREIFQYGSRCDGGLGRPYLVNNGVMKNSNEAYQYLYRLTDAQWMGLLAVFDPQLYLDIADGRNDGRLYAGTNVILQAKCFSGTSHFFSLRTETGEFDLYAGHEYPHQAWYDNAASVGEYVSGFVRDRMRATPTSMSFGDAVGRGGAMLITRIEVSCATNDVAVDSDAWMPLLSWTRDAPDEYDCSAAQLLSERIPGIGGVELAGTAVTLGDERFSFRMTNICMELWFKAELNMSYTDKALEGFIVDCIPQIPSESGLPEFLPVIKTYDGEPTGVVLHVDWPSQFPSAEHGSRIEYAVGYDTAAEIPDSAWQAESPLFVEPCGATRVWCRLFDDRCGPITNSTTVTVAGGQMSAENMAFAVTPYVQHPTPDGMTILYFTTNAVASKVRCWPVGNPQGCVTATTIGCENTNLVACSSSEASVPPLFRHRVRFDGLKSGTEYAYEVILKSGVRYRNRFRTVPDRDTPVRFVAYSDSETTPDAQPDTSWDVLTSAGNSKMTYYVSRSVGFATNIVHMQDWKPDLIVIAGDLVARGGVQTYWNEFWRHNAGANVDGFNDPAGSTPILAALGNHDLYDNKGSSWLTEYSYGQGGEFAIMKYLSYFEFNTNGVDYAGAQTYEKDARDKSMLFHREDYGSITLIFLDVNNGDDNDQTRDTNRSLSRTGSHPARSPDFNEGSLQYQWLERNLAEARDRSRFVFVVSHHCPFSVGKHNFANGKSNGSEIEALSAQPVRALLPLLHQYGVTAWLCGHDEIQEHSQHVGTEVLSDGSTRQHVLQIYDLGSAGDGLRGREVIANPQEVFRAYKDSADGVHYGHLQVEVKQNRKGVWQCTMTPMCSKITDSSGTSTCLAYADSIVISEDGSVTYEQRKGVTLMEGEGSVVVGDEGTVTVSESVHRLHGTVPEKVKVVHSTSGGEYDITSAFNIETNVASDVILALNPRSSVHIGTKEVRVIPELAAQEDEAKPLSVGETVEVGVRTIPGLTYGLKRTSDLSGLSEATVVTEQQAHGTCTVLQDPMSGGKPSSAFYTIEVKAE